MFTMEVVKCSDMMHKARCLVQVKEAVENARHGNEWRNGRKVTIRGAITDPCACHLDAAIYLASLSYARMGGSLAYMSDDAHGLLSALYRNERI